MRTIYTVRWLLIMFNLSLDVSNLSADVVAVVCKGISNVTHQLLWVDKNLEPVFQSRYIITNTATAIQSLGNLERSDTELDYALDFSILSSPVQSFNAIVNLSDN